IQKHQARRLHYDLRLEVDGVLKSWAVPKGPSLDPSQKPLAVQTEDHPIEYGGFEGVIPKGQYGAGTVMLWDVGEWEPLSDPVEGLEKGDFKFRLHGAKLKGDWVLARMGGKAEEDGKNWLLIKKKDEEARPLSEFDIQAHEPRSALTGRTMREITADPQREWTREGERPAPGAGYPHRPGWAPFEGSSKTELNPRRAESARTEPPGDRGGTQIPGARKARMPATISPQLA